MEAQGDNKLSLSNVGRKDRQKFLFDAMLAYPSYVSYGERIRDLAARVGTTPKMILQTAKRHHWETQLSNIIEAQKTQDAFTKLLDDRAPLTKSIPFSKLADGIKSLSFVALNASLQYVSTTAVLIDFYTKKIAHAVATSGGVTHLDEPTAKQVQSWQAQLAYNTKNIQEYIKPSALASLLGLINFSQQLPTDAGERDDTAFTIDSLYHRLKALGMLSAFDSGQADKAVEGYGPLPEIDGFTNARSDERLQYGLPPEPDETTEQ
ncbi:MAG: hypothetical protein ACRYG7_31900 [Janthinobacterium lividum]